MILPKQAAGVNMLVGLVFKAPGEHVTLLSAVRRFADRTATYLVSLEMLAFSRAGRRSADTRLPLDGRGDLVEREEMDALNSEFVR
jgi:hypothetical protein